MSRLRGMSPGNKLAHLLHRFNRVRTRLQKAKSFTARPSLRRELPHLRSKRTALKRRMRRLVRRHELFG